MIRTHYVFDKRKPEENWPVLGICIECGHTFAYTTQRDKVYCGPLCLNRVMARLSRSRKKKRGDVIKPESLNCLNS